MSLVMFLFAAENVANVSANASEPFLLNDHVDIALAVAPSSVPSWTLTKTPSLTPTKKLPTPPTIAPLSTSLSPAQDAMRSSASGALTSVSPSSPSAAVFRARSSTLHVVSSLPSPTLHPTEIIVAASERSIIDILPGVAFIGFVLIGSAILLVWWKQRSYRR